MNHVGILIVCFKRFDYLENYIRLGLRVGIKRFYFAIDGPDSEETERAQRFFQAYIQSKYESEELQLNWWVRSKNLGLAVSMITAIDWFFKNESSGIILEDDLLFDEDFLKFCISNLDRYHDTDIFSISGNQVLRQNMKGSSLNFGHYPLIWGWATWKDKWESIREIYNFEDGLKLKQLTQLRPRVFGFWFAGWLRVRDGVLSSWALPFAAISRASGWKHIYPQENLVQNIGVDIFATHTTELTKATSRILQKATTYSIDCECTGESVSGVDKAIENDFYLICRRNALSPAKYLAQRIFGFYPKSTPLKEKIIVVEIP
jgi:hypothetical protein